MLQNGHIKAQLSLKAKLANPEFCFFFTQEIFWLSEAFFAIDYRHRYHALAVRQKEPSHPLQTFTI
jgi:hypothetical protein